MPLDAAKCGDKSETNAFVKSNHRLVTREQAAYLGILEVRAVEGPCHGPSVGQTWIFMGGHVNNFDEEFP